MHTIRKILFLIPCSDFIPSGKVRVLNYVPYFKEQSIRCKVLSYHHPLTWKCCERLIINGGFLSLLKRFSRRFLRYVDAFYQKWVQMCILVSARKYDAILIQWLPLPKNFIKRLLRKNSNLIFDFDDAVFLGMENDASFILSNSRIVIAGSQYLSDYAIKFNRNVVMIPSCVPLKQFDAYREDRENNEKSKLVIGWIGSPGTVDNVEMLTDVFHVLARKYSIQLKLVGMGNRECPIRETEKLEILTVPYYNEREMIKYAFSFDIGINPLRESEFSRGKTSLKTIIYMAAGLPVISSPIGGSVDVILHGVNGFLAGTRDEWLDALTLLIEDNRVRREMGEKGLLLVRDGYTTDHCFKLLHQALLGKDAGP
jgi:glycosyltransferase involved in cell wall biosynthesis